MRENPNLVLKGNLEVGKIPVLRGYPGRSSFDCLIQPRNHWSHERCRRLLQAGW